MVSRRRILSRSRDELHSELFAAQKQEEQDDIWATKEQLFRDHVQEVVDKWESIDDEIWAKIIVLERNRRVAKAYARAPVLTVNGSDDGFDGFRIGVGGFDNPMRDAATKEIIRHIGQGFKLKMDDVGNILIKRISKSGVRVKNTTQESAVSNDILKLPGGLLEPDKPFKIFDMKKFQQNMNRELKRPYPDRRKLESQCISAVSFGGDNTEVLDCPIWIVCINIVAIEMLRAKLPPLSQRARPRSMEPRSLMPMSAGANNSNVGPGGGPQSMMMMTRHPFTSGSSDEDPYSVAGSGSSGSSGNGNRSRSRDKPPKLPPRDNAIYGPSLWAKPTAAEAGLMARERSNKLQLFNDKRGDDPYYCGLRARIPNFVKSKANNNSSSKGGGAVEKAAKKGPKDYFKLRSSSANAAAAGGPVSLPPQIPSHPFWWHSRLYNGGGAEQGLMSLSSDQAPSTSTNGSHATSNQQSSASSSNGNATLATGKHYRRNPTNFVPYITANGNEYDEEEDLY